jgi:spore maturation protein CgeB
MKKILFVDLEYDYGNPARGPNTIGQLGFIGSLKKLGYEVTTFYYDKLLNDLPVLQSELLKKADELRPDLIFFIIFRDQFSLETLKALKLKYRTVNWFGDDTWRFESFTQKYAPYFTYNITTDKFSVPKYHKIGCQNVVISQWAAIDCDFTPAKTYEFDVSFVGGFNQYRGWFVKQLKKMGHHIECFGHGWKNGPVSHERMIEIFSASKINLNLSNSASFDFRYLCSHPKNFVHSFYTKKQASQIKARNFEISYFNGFQLTDFVPGIEDYYIIGKEIACYSTVEEAALLIEYYLHNNQEREAIKNAGFQKAKKRYTYTAQLQEVLTAIL